MPVICTLDDLSIPGTRAFSIPTSGWPLRGFLVRTPTDVHAYVNRCPHAGHPLNMRPDEFLTADRSLIICNSHGALFELDSGLCVAGPCPGRSLSRIPVRIEGNNVVIDDVERLARELA